MTECTWCKDEFCTNPDCPLRADYCPVPYDAEVCRWEERREIQVDARMTPMQAWSVISANLAELYTRRKSNAFKGYTDKDVEAEVIAFKALQEMEERKRVSNGNGKNKDNRASE